MFRTGISGTVRGTAAVEQFENSKAPIRWWHLSVPVTETGEIAVRLPGQAPPLIREDGSRLTTRIRNDLQGVFVIVDIGRAAGVSLQQLGDYVGMVALAQVDPEADTAPYDTVLNLFDGGNRTDGLTDWDISFLTSLYDAELNQRQSNAQVGAISSIMLRDRTRAQQSSEDEGSPPQPR